MIFFIQIFQDLSENDIGYEGVKHLCALLIQSDSLKRLSIRSK